MYANTHGMSMKMVRRNITEEVLMKSTLIYAFLLASALCISAWMGIADAKAAAQQTRRANISALRTPNESPSGTTPKKAVEQQRAHQTTRSRIPLTRPMASSAQRTINPAPPASTKEQE